jgi:hypothetical protein
VNGCGIVSSRCHTVTGVTVANCDGAHSEALSSRSIIRERSSSWRKPGPMLTLNNGFRITSARAGAE